MSGLDTNALIQHLIDTSSAVHENVKEVRDEQKKQAEDLVSLKTELATSRGKWDDAAEAIVRISALEIYAKIAVWMLGVAVTGSIGFLTAWAQGWIGS
ncbi:MAG: hypothetical protein AAFV46_00160 [Cyanobacteria bacterium J06635_11]